MKRKTFCTKNKMNRTGETNSQANARNSFGTNTQQPTTTGNTNNGFQASSQEKDKPSSFLQKWFGSQSGQQDKDKQSNTSKRSGVMSWGEDVHYII